MKIIHDRKYRYSNGWGYIRCSAEYCNIATSLEFAEFEDAARRSLEEYLRRLEKDGHVGERIIYDRQDRQYADLISEISTREL